MKSYHFLALLLTYGVSATAGTVPVTLENKNLRPLGAGYNSRTQTLFQKCVDNSADDGTTPATKPELARGNFDLTLESEQSALSEKLGISAGGKYRSGAVTASASAEFLKQSSSNSFSIAYNYVSEHVFQEVMDPTRLHPIRPLPGFTNDVTKSDIFFGKCGDEYVRSREMAARLFLNINVSFVSKSERNRFAAKFGIESPATDFEASFENDSKRFSANNRMTIRVIQVGGDPSKIGKALCPTNYDTGSELKPDVECAKSSQAIVNCSFGDIKICTKMIANAIAYANAQDGENFPTQIREFKGYTVTSLETAPYVGLGQPFLNPPSAEKESEFKAARTMVSDMFESQYSLWTYSNRLYKGRAPRLSDRQKNEMEKIQNLHFKNVVRASNAVQNCYDLGYAECTAEYERVRAYIGLDRNGKIEAEQYDTIESLTAPEMFVQYCDLADDEHREIKTTIESLFAYAKAKAGETQTLDRGDKCRNLAEWMNEQSSIDMSEYSLPLGSLEPFSTLLNLESLNLSGKNIESITALSTLTRLKSLTLDNNLIRDLKPLNQMKSLESLSIQNNQLDPSALTTLASLGESLKSIDARGNLGDLRCPLRDKTRCKLLSFKDALDVIPMHEKCSIRVGHQSVGLDKDRVLATGGHMFDGISYYRADMQIISRGGCRSVTSELKMARAGHTMTRLRDGRILVAGGHVDSVEWIDPRSLATSLTMNRMTDIRSQHTATLLEDDSVLIVGGYQDVIDYAARSSNVSSTIDRVHPNGVIESFGALSSPRAEHTATLLEDGRVLIVGGYAFGQMNGLVEIIDPASKTIERLDHLSIPRMGHTASLMGDGRVLIVGGYRWETEVIEGVAEQVLSSTDEILIFDPSTRTVKKVADKLTPARGGMVGVPMHDGRIMLIGGESKGGTLQGRGPLLASTMREVQLFDPDSEALYSLGNLFYGRNRFTATPLDSRSVFVVGGAGVNGSAQSAELLVYRPK